MIECEKRGLSVLEENQLGQEEIADALWKKLGRTDYVFEAIMNKERLTQEMLKEIEEKEGNDDVFHVAETASAVEKKKRVKQYHIVGLAATRLNDSRKKWRLNKVVMGGEDLLTS